MTSNQFYFLFPNYLSLQSYVDYELSVDDSFRDLTFCTKLYVGVSDHI